MKESTSANYRQRLTRVIDYIHDSINGTSFSSGLLIFQSGDRKDMGRRNLIAKLLKKGLTV